MNIEELMENARLKGRVIALEAELEEARRGSGAGMKVMLGLSDDLVAENARLKADVNELADGLKLASEIGIKMADEVTRLKAEVERLRKAGDAMYEELGNFGMTWNFREAWNAAKEGRQS